MKNLFSTILAFLCILSTNAQSDSLFLSISPLKENVLYFGVENPISIGITNICGQMPEVKISCGTIKCAGNGEYLARLDIHCGPQTTITVSYNQKGKKHSTEHVFRNKEITNVGAMVGGKRGGQVHKNWLLTQTGVIASAEYSEFDLKFNVISFELNAISGEYAVTAKSQGFKFTSAQYEIIKKSKVGDKIYIENIQAIGPDGIIRDLGGIVFDIKEN